MPGFYCWLSRLGDDFAMFPLESVEDLLSRHADECSERILDRAAWPEMATWFRPIESEQDDAVIYHLQGAAFVLAQGAITQTIAAFGKVRALAGDPKWLPKWKVEILRLSAANRHSASGESEQVLIDAVANYYKHHHEWPDDWISGTDVQNRTIE